MKRKLILLAPIACLLLMGVWNVFAQTTHSATLTWGYTQGSDPAVGFFVQRGTSASGPFVNLNATALPIATLTYKDTAVVAGTTYWYEVYAVDAAGNQSAPDGPATVTIPGNPNPPQALQVVSN